VGLLAFESRHERYFFGRSHVAEVIVDNLLTRPITVLYGSSGTGKSSVLNVGVVSALKRELGEINLVVRREWHAPDELQAWLRDQVAAAKPDMPLIIFFDQFEEYFLYRTPEASDAFERDLVRVLSNPALNAHLLISLRSDALHALDGLRLRFHTIMENMIELAHLDQRGVREAIEGPIRVYNEGRPARGQVTLDPGFVDHLLKELTGSLAALGQQRPSPSAPVEVELPFLQLALLRLWRRVVAKDGPRPRRITPDLLAAEGGVDGVVGAHVREKLDGDLSKAERQLASQIFHYLVTPSGGKFAYTPQDLAALASESAGEPVEEKAVATLLNKLAEGDARILRRTGDRFELFHDVLARPILNWRAEFRQSAYLDEAPYAYLVDIFTGSETALTGVGNLFGRHPPEIADITPLAASTVSRTHVLIMRDHLILDMRSRYGTTVNAAPVHFGETGIYLRDGDVIALANTAGMVYRTHADRHRRKANHRLPAPSLLRTAWGYLIDGHSRRVCALTDDATFLGHDRSRILVGGEKDIEQPFARLSVEEGKAWLCALSDDPPIEVIERRDSYFDNVVPLATDEPFEIDLKDLQLTEVPTAMGDLEGAHRSVFHYAGTNFEIILNVCHATVQ
jgi:hypothetical protein